MKTLLESGGLLDRGGKPTVRDLLASLVFNPSDGTIRLHDDRLVMQRAAVGVELRRELVRLLGPAEARVFLIRLGFLCGQADARFVRTSWPGLDAGDAFTAGTRLHTFSGTVRVETVHNDFDLRKKRFSGEFLWHDSVEAAEHRKAGQATDAPVCWTQVGYASGYASEFFDTLIVYKEVACCAEGHKACRVVGKPAQMWAAGDPEVALFRERIAGQGAAPVRPATLRVADAGLPDLDRILLAPVRGWLDRLAGAAVPVLVAGPAGTGRFRAASHLHRADGGAPGDLRRVAGREVTADLVAGLAGGSSLGSSGGTRPGRRGGAAGTVAIDAVEEVPDHLQAALAAAIEGGPAGRPRVVALTTRSPERLRGEASMRRELWLALAPATVRMPALAERPDDRLPLAEALLEGLAQRSGGARARLSPEAERLVARAPWPGNLPEMRAVLTAAALARAGDGPLGGAEIEAQRARLSPTGPDAAPEAGRVGAPWIDAALGQGGLPLAALEAEILDAAVARAGGNLAAAARLVGLTRPQLAYRLGGRRRAGGPPGP